MSSLDKLQKIEAKLTARRTLLKASLKDRRKDLEEAEADLREWDDAVHIAQTVARNVQEVAHSRISRIVSRCLEAVFDEPYRFAINFEQKRGRTEAVLVFIKDGDLECDPLTASGGGVVDVAAFALRLACLTLAQPPQRRLMVMDEPFKFVSAEHRLRLRQLLHDLATEFDMQFVIVTHITELEMGKVVRL